MNTLETKRIRKPKATAAALFTLLALLSGSLSTQDCGGAACGMAQAMTARCDDCDGAARSQSPEMKSSRNMMCDAAVLPARLENPAEKLRGNSKLRADSTGIDTLDLDCLATSSDPNSLRWRLAGATGPDLTETKAILALRI